VKVTRTGTGRDTRYSVEVVGAAQAPVALPSGESIKGADAWAKLMSRLICRKDFLDIVASEIETMTNEGYWQ